MEYINIPNSVYTIGYCCFKGCTKLENVMIGSKVYSIDEYAFSYCENLTDVYCYATTVPSANNSVFYNSFVESATTLHVPASSLNAYSTTAPWSSFGTIVAIDGTPEPEPPVLEKCATPTISYAGNQVSFSCTTPGVSFVYDIKVSGATGVASQVTLKPTYSVSVYATKSGYEDSSTASMVITPAVSINGDVNADGAVTISDAVGVVNIILNQ